MMCLTDNQFKNLPAGDVVDKLINEWRTKSLEESLMRMEYFSVK